jgi:hypothetical protein
VAADFRLYKTTDAGLSWSLKGDFIEGIRAIYFLNENTGWLGATNDVLYKSTNGGINWLTTSFPPLFGTVTDLYFFNSNRGYGGNRSLRILITTNDGVQWGYQRDSSASYRITFIDTSAGWSGDFGISHTTNGGGPITYVGIININQQTPKCYVLYQNYPNPFNSQTNIRFSINKPSYVKLKLYDILGREKDIWSSTGLLSPGTHELSFNAENYSSGVYFYQITILNEHLSVVYRETKKMILVK